MHDSHQSWAPGVIRASFAKSAKQYDRAARRGEAVAVPFGRYLLLDRIKRGGMAEVYRAKVVGHEGFEKIVAIKRILPHLAANEDFVTMFIDEAKIVSFLNHQNVCPVIELGRCEDGLYIVMEYIWGRDLRQILNALARTGRLMPITVAAYVAARICEGLDYAHRRAGPTGQRLDIVHRDISPQNVLISFDGEIKIIDFGIASASQRSTETRAGTFKGKFAYMSPEQARGQVVDRRSDIFAAGILLHEMITGARLFAGKTDLETLDRVRNCDVPPPARPFEDVPEELIAIVLKALAKKPEARFQWAGEMQEALDRFLLLSGELATASRLGTWICLNFSEEAAKALVEQERASRASAPGGRGDDRQSDPPDSGGFSAASSNGNINPESVSVSAVVDDVSRSVSAVVEDPDLEFDEDAFAVPVEVDEDAFAVSLDVNEDAFEGDTPVSSVRPGLDFRSPASGIRAAPQPNLSPAARARSEMPTKPPAAPRRPVAERPSHPPSSTGMRVPTPPPPPPPSVRKKRKLNPVEVEYSPWTRFEPVPNEELPPEPCVDETPPTDKNGLVVSASFETAAPEATIIDEPPPDCQDDEDTNS